MNKINNKNIKSRITKPLKLRNYVLLAKMNTNMDENITISHTDSQ